MSYDTTTPTNSNSTITDNPDAYTVITDAAHLEMKWVISDRQKDAVKQEYEDAKGSLQRQYLQAVGQWKEPEPPVDPRQERIKALQNTLTNVVRELAELQPLSYIVHYVSQIQIEKEKNNGN
jgi:hypothetical protein